MKIELTTFTTLAAVLLSAGISNTALSQLPPTGPDISLLSSRNIEMVPSDKRPLAVKSDERNPYAKRAPEEEEVIENSEDSQESRIRTRLLSMPVGGCSLGENGRQILVGSIILKKGHVVDPILPDQTEFLKVLKITDKEINFGWLDGETGELSGKTMQIAYDLSPGVRYLLPGTSSEGDVTDRTMGVIRVDEKRKQAAAEYERINPQNLLPAGVYERAQ